jgi:cell shape-determining protein MreC
MSFCHIGELKELNNVPQNHTYDFMIAVIKAKAAQKWKMLLTIQKGHTHEQ